MFYNVLATKLKSASMHLDWYVHVSKLKYDLRSSGISHFTYDLTMSNLDLSANFSHGNPETTVQLARWYGVNPESIFLSSEGASGQNARIIRYLAEKNPRKNVAIVEYPTYEPLLRQVQEHFKQVKRLTRTEQDAYKLDPDRLAKLVSEKTGLLVLTNPHAPSGAISETKELNEVMGIARAHDFYVLCDEIYAEFDRKIVPTLYSADHEHGIAHALIAAELLSKNSEKLEQHKQKWTSLRQQTQQGLEEKGLEFFPSKVGVTFWVKTPIEDTHKWTNGFTVPQFSLAAVPGAFFLFKNDYKLRKTNKVRLSLGNINPDAQILMEALNMLNTGMSTYKHA